jgi:hypothetical protein
MILTPANTVTSKLAAILSFSGPLISVVPTTRPAANTAARFRNRFSSPCPEVQWMGPSRGGISATSGYSQLLVEDQQFEAA